MDAISVAVDHAHEGSARTKNRALKCVDTEWTAVLDSDDLWYPEHVDLLLRHAQETGADMVYPWFEVEGGQDPFPWAEGQPFTALAPRLPTENWIPTTVLVRTSFARGAGGFQQSEGFRPEDPLSSACDDWALWRKLRAMDAKIEHLNRRTWKWVWHRTEDDRNTSGRGDRW